MRSSAVAFALLAGCFDRPDVLVMCHNSNCTEPHDPSRDDAIPSLRKSLALVGDDGMPIIDGIELDLFRHEGECLYAHDVSHLEGHVDIREGAAVLADYLMTHEMASHNGHQFTVKIEMKPEVDGKGETFEQVTCGLEVHEILRTAAVASGNRVEMVFDSYNPAILAAVHARRPGDDNAITTKLSIDYGVSPPLTPDNYRQDKIDVPLDIAEVHGGWITDTALRALRSRGLEFSAWSFDLTRETLHDIERIDPKYALTGQARTLRAWLDR